MGPYDAVGADPYDSFDGGNYEEEYKDPDYHSPPPYADDGYNDPEFGPEYSPPPHQDYGHLPVHDDYGYEEEPYGAVPVHDDYGAVPIHDGYGPPPHDGYGPPSSDYGAPSADYGPPKIKGPVLLEKRPYEVTEIRAVPIVTHQTYTKFDCRNVPYPDRHYADPEAGCAVSDL